MLDGRVVLDVVIGGMLKLIDMILIEVEVVVDDIDFFVFY